MDKVNAILEGIISGSAATTITGKGGRRQLRWQLFGRPLCLRAWRRISGINPWRCAKLYYKGIKQYQAPKQPRPSVAGDQMHGAIWVVIKHFADSSPYARTDPDDIQMPFSEKVYLFRLVQLWHARSAVSTASPGSSLFTRPPSYRTFLSVLRRPEFAKVKFHRVVQMARCPKCCLYRWKCMSSPLELRVKWQTIAAAHHWLQLAQKRQYAKDRATAASDYPDTELYMALDGGSGHEFVLPHMAAKSPEVPSKAIAGFHTVPLKVMNGLVHGDTRSHVVLSPGTVLAGASHTCEAIMIVVNTAFHDHGDVPDKVSVQLDNASSNHNMLVLAVLALYVRFLC